MSISAYFRFAAWQSFVIVAVVVLIFGCALCLRLLADALVQDEIMDRLFCQDRSKSSKKTLRCRRVGDLRSDENYGFTFF